MFCDTIIITFILIGGAHMIGKKVKTRREELGLTQEELAKKLGYKSKSTINKIEKDINDVNQTNLVRLATALDVDVTYFIDADVPNENTAVFIETYSRLSDTDKSQIMRYMRFLLKEEG